MKKWKIILASVLALLILVVTPLSIMAQSETTPTPAAKPELKGALAIVAPWVVRTGEQMSLTVFLRRDQSTMAGVGVWAVTRDKVEALKQAAKTLRDNKGINASDEDYQNLLSSFQAISLGSTDSNGKLTYTFNNPDRYLLVAAKAQYVPGFTRLVVRELLAISAPKKAAPGDSVTITVDQKGTSTPVADANVWIVKWENVKALKDALAQARSSNGGNLPEANAESVLGPQSIIHGKTDANGQFTYTFNNAGRYLLVATKEACVPGLAGIAIVAPVPTAATPPASASSNEALH